MNTAKIEIWDIFCRVVDNYGDIGVCWRLARQLSDEYPLHIRLWVDDLSALMAILPSTTHCDRQTIDKVEIHAWHAAFEPLPSVGDVVIEAFACDVPASYLAAMQRRAIPPRWFNLEYLSAEDWVEGCHGLTSTHPQTGLKKVFFFPGFSAKTGGLIKERHLLAMRDAFTYNETERQEFLRSLGVDVAPSRFLLSLFAYENPAMASLLEAWTKASQEITCLVPHGKIVHSISEYFGRPLSAGDEIQQGSLQLKVIPFLTQANYDKLLWACDFNFVRGEDSFVRAQWAAKPCVWHIYPQEDGAHLPKLAAFLKRYLASSDPSLAEKITFLWHQWNSGDDTSKAWEPVFAHYHKWHEEAKKWAIYLDSLDNIAAKLVNFR